MFGLEDDELRAHIDLYQRRQERLQRMKSQSTPAPTNTISLLSSKGSPGRTPPPPYVGMVTSGPKEAAKDASNGIVREEEEPPLYSIAISRQRPCNVIWKDAAAKASSTQANDPSSDKAAAQRDNSTWIKKRLKSCFLFLFTYVRPRLSS